MAGKDYFDIGDQIRLDKFTEAKKKLEDGLNNLSEKINENSLLISTAVTVMGDEVSEGIDRTYKNIETFGTDMTDSIKEKMETVKDVVAKTLEPLATDAGIAMERVHNTLIAPIKRVSASVSEAMGKVTASLVSPLTNAVGRVSSAAKDVVSKITGPIRTVAGTVGTAMKAVKSKIESSLKESAKVAGTKSGEISKEVKKNMSGMGSAVQKSTKSVGTAMTGLKKTMSGLAKDFKKVKDFVKVGFDNLTKESDSAKKTMDDLNQNLVKVKNSIAAALMPAIQTILPVVTKFTDKVVDLLNSAGMIGAYFLQGAEDFTQASTVIGDGAKMFESVAIPEDLRTGIDGMTEALHPAMEAFKGLWEALVPLGEFTLGSLMDFYELFLKPVGSWVLGDAIPRLVDMLKEGLQKIDLGTISAGFQNLLKALEPFTINIGEGLLWLWENILIPFGTWTSNTLIPLFLDQLTAGLQLLNGILEMAKPIFAWLWEEFLSPVAGWTGGAIAGTLELIIGLMQTLAGVITGDVDLAYIGIEKIKTSVSSLTESFSGAFKTIRESIPKFIKAIGNLFATGIVGIANGAISVIEDAINSIIGKINSIGSSIGLGSFIPRVSMPRIQVPKLATGAVIPPNAEFLAVLGDQKHGRNLEAPENLIRQIVREETAGIGNGGDVVINVSGSASSLIKQLKFELDRENKRQGRSLIKGATAW